MRGIDWFPPVLAVLIAVLALVAVGHALVTTAHRRRSELALLKTLGFERGQVRATLAWQATTLAIVGLAVGIPAGVFVGNVVWRAKAPKALRRHRRYVLRVSAVDRAGNRQAIPRRGRNVSRFRIR